MLEDEDWLAEKFNEYKENAKEYLQKRIMKLEMKKWNKLI